MRTAGVREARQNLTDLLDDVKKGREVVITDRGRPVASTRNVVLVYFLYLMDFELEPAKSAANLKKHGRLHRRAGAVERPRSARGPSPLA